MFRLGVLFFSILFITGCGNENLPEYVVLGDLRVLALVVDSPETSAGSTVTLTPVISDLNGRGRTLTYSAEACVDPGVSLGADPSCEGKSDRVVLATNQSVTGISSPEYTGSATSTVSVTIPTSVFDGRSTVEQYNGVSYLFIYTLRASDGNQVKALKRIIVSTKTTKNQNPVLNSILVGGTALSVLPTTKIFLSAGFSGASREVYQSLTGSGAFVSNTESLTTTWFITDGAVDAYRTENENSVGYTPPTNRPSGRSIVLLPVIRDIRGGEAVLKLTL